MVTVRRSRLYCVVEHLYEILSWNMSEEWRDGGGGSPELVNHTELQAGHRHPKFAIDLDTLA